MPDSSDLNALYQEWLEIPAERLPPNHYALLGLSDFESDTAEIESAAKSRSAYLHQIAAGPQRKIVQKMLGEVAIARRTLMSEDARIQYDQLLRSTGETPVQAGAIGSTPSSSAQGSDGAPSGARPSAGKRPDESRPVKAATLTTPRKSSDWKYHAISAAVLLLIVGVIYWINRSPGGRRAAEARSTEQKSSAPIRSPKVTGTGAVSSAKRKTSVRMAPAVASGSRSSSRKSPIAKKRDTGSGLGMGLENKFGDVLSDIAKQPDKSAAGKKPDESKRFQPLGGLLISPVNKTVEPDQWPQELTAVAEFPLQMEDRFESDHGFDWYDVTEKGIRIKTVKDNHAFELTDKRFELTPGSVISLRTSLAAKMGGEVQIGFVIDGIRIGLRPCKNGVEVIARDRGTDVSVDSVTKIKTGSKRSSLTLVRDAEKTNTIRWFVRTDDQDQTGTIGVTSLGANPSTAWFVNAPKQDLKRPFWVSELKTRSGGR